MCGLNVNGHIIKVKRVAISSKFLAAFQNFLPFSAWQLDLALEGAGDLLKSIVHGLGVHIHPERLPAGRYILDIYIHVTNLLAIKSEAPRTLRGASGIQ